MKDNLLEKLTTATLNSILFNGFDCSNIKCYSKNGFEYVPELDMYSISISFDNTDEFRQYGTIVVGDYLPNKNKFYPFDIISYNFANKETSIMTSIKELTIAMVDMDNKYNCLNNNQGLPENNILRYEYIKIDKEYIIIELNSINVEKIINVAMQNNIYCEKEKFETCYINNKLLISKDEKTGVFIVDYINNDKKTIFKDNDIVKFYEFLEAESLKYLLSENTIIKKKKKYTKREKKQIIQDYVDELLEYSVYRLEDEVNQMQTEELEIASNMLYEQYEYHIKIINELKLYLDGKSSMKKVVEIYANGLGKKMACIKFLEQKTYLHKPRNYMKNLFQNIRKEKYFKFIDKNIRKEVQKKFFEELDDFQYNTIQPEIIGRSKAFGEQIEELNIIVDEISLLLEKIRSERISKDDAFDEIKINEEKIKNINVKLRSSYKKVHEFATYLGFEPLRQKGTSHLIYSKNGITVPIPNKKGDIKPGLLSSIIKQLGSSRTEFCNFNL